MAAKVKPSAFRILSVVRRQPLKQFLTSLKLDFAKGKAFYELTKGEVIQDYKTVVVMRRSDQSFITGEAVREVLEIPKTGNSRFVLDSDKLPDFQVFVQSTSHNRVVLPGTKLLYKMEDEIEDDGKGEGASSSTADTTAVSTRQTRKTRAAAKEVSVPEPAAKKSKTATIVEAEKRPPTSAATSADASSGPTEIAFSFDTTGSMYACLAEVRLKLQATISRLKKDIPGIRMAVIAHGDYCDAGSSYVTSRMDFTDDVEKLCSFVANVKSTGGGDFDECYELVLREAHSLLTWSPTSQKSLVVIGDATPHATSYPLNKDRIDWKQECQTLKTKGIKIYAVQALNRSVSTSFYRSLAELTGGFHLMLDQFSSIVDFMMAICYREKGQDQLQSFEAEVRTRGMNREMHRLFDNLAGRTTVFSNAGATSGLVPVNPSRFQVLTVDRKCSIKDFVIRNSLMFKTGRGFYEFTKPEAISDKKEVVLVDKLTGDMFTGKEACAMIGAGGSGKIKPTSLEKFRVFVQSTSYNRELVANTGFLYEVDTDH